MQKKDTSKRDSRELTVIIADGYHAMTFRVLCAFSPEVESGVVDQETRKLVAESFGKARTDNLHHFNVRGEVIQDVVSH